MSVPATERFEPQILVFACNWCSYAGADAAGVGRVQYAPNVRLLRVMCSGRVHPGFVLRAFAEGADGVMVSGCHFGDCHYNFGNHRAVDQYEITKSLCKLLGIEPGRIALEWISAAEGPRFGQVMNEFTDQVRALGPMGLWDGVEKSTPTAGNGGRPVTQVARELGLTRCLECGRCSAVCPVSRSGEAFTPRRTIAEVLAGIQDVSTLFSCLTCGRCDAVCPAGISQEPIMLGLRRDVVHRFEQALANDDVLTQPAELLLRAKPSGKGSFPAISHGGMPHHWMRLMGSPNLVPDRPRFDDEGLTIHETGETLFLVGCQPFFDAAFDHLDEPLDGFTRGALKVLAAIGVEPAVLADERCCGHDLLYMGDEEGFRRLAARNREAFTRAGVKRIVTACPECFHTLGTLYPDLLDDWPFEVLHLADLVAPHMDELAARTNGYQIGPVAFQDPCRLGRMHGFYDEPRQLLERVAGAEVREMAHTREEGTCCGVTGWAGCGSRARSIQLGRLDEARQTGAEALVTACAKCRVHFTCANRGLDDDQKVPLRDLWSLVASALTAGEAS